MSSDGLADVDETDGSDASTEGVPDGSDAPDDPATLRTRLELLEEENSRLRDEYARARQSRYQRTALGLAGLGTVAALGGLLFPTARTVLFALAGTGVFLGVLTYYLTPEQFLPATIGRTVYGTLAANEQHIVAGLGLRERRVYVPVQEGNVRLFVPQHEDHKTPDEDALDEVFVVTDDPGQRGVSLAPTGDGLADEFEQAVTGGVGGDPGTLAAQATDALVEQFELVDQATPDVDPEGGRVTVALGGSTFGRVDRFDHPVVSFLASVFARGLDTPVETAVETDIDSPADYRVTLTWSATDD